MKSITAFALLATVLVNLCMSTNVLGIGFLEQKFNNFQSTDPLSVKYEIRKFNQLTEHPKNQSTFHQRYWYNAEKYDNGPIILYNSGEGKFEDSLGTDNFLLTLAKELKGIFVVIEHRYYGESNPDYSGENKYFLLTPEQSLEDMAYFIKNVKFPDLKHPPTKHTPWIIYGCSYPGVLAAWMRKEYPSLVFASIASSAPVQLKVDFWQYYNTVYTYGKLSQPDCIQAIQTVVEHVDSILSGKDTAKQLELKRKFGLEGIINNSEFGNTIACPLGNWQYISPGDDQFAGFCSNFSGSTDPLEAYASYIKSGYCKNEDNNAWFYQTCAHFGYYQSAPREGPTIISRSVTAEYYEDGCVQTFGKNVPLQPNVTYYNKKYGGWNVELENIIWVDGERDPWRQLSVASPEAPKRKNTSQSLYLTIPKATHCWDLLTTDNIPKEVKAVRSLIKETLSGWLMNRNVTYGTN